MHPRGPLVRALPGSPGAIVALLLTALLFAVIVPMMNTVVRDGSALHLPDYIIPLIGKYLCYAILALALDLVWGYCGVLSLGHGAFFALGGYAMGMYLMRQIGTRGVYRDPILPDFMVFLNWKELPWYWYGFNHFWFACLMAMLVPGILAAVFGFLAFRSRITGVYLSIITQAMTYALLLAFFRNDMGFGGNNGLTDFKDLLGFNLQERSTKLALYYTSLAALGLALLACRMVVATKLGRVMMAVRDAEPRVRFLGYSVTSVKLFAFVLSAMLAGIAGALYVPQIGIINPSEFSPANSIEIAIWVAVGGRGTLVGPILGALAVNGAKTYLSAAFPETWLFCLGGLFILVTLLLPRGVMGVFDRFRLGRQGAAVPAPDKGALREDGKQHA